MSVQIDIDNLNIDELEDIASYLLKIGEKDNLALLRQYIEKRIADDDWEDIEEEFSDSSEEDDSVEEPHFEIGMDKDGFYYII